MTTDKLLANRELAVFIMRHLDAIDLMLGHIGNAAERFEGSEEFRKSIFHVVNEIHTSLRYPVIKLHTDLDIDKTV